MFSPCYFHVIISIGILESNSDKSWIFSPFSNFSNTPYVAKVFEQAVGPGVLQTFSTCAVKH